MSIHPFAPGSRLFKAFHECRVAVSTANYSKSAWEELESAIDAAICPSPDHPEMVARREAWGKICAAVASVAAAAVEASKPETIESVAEATARFEKYLSGLMNFRGSFGDTSTKVANEAASIFGRVPAACRVSVSHGNLDGVCKAISDRIHGAGCWAKDFVLEVVKDEMARMVPPKSQAAPLVAATERRANALESVNRVIATPGIGAAAAGILTRVREFIESTVPADEVKPSEVIFGDGTEIMPRAGIWQRFHGEEPSGAWNYDGNSRTTLARGVSLVRVADVPEPPVAPKPAFELPPPGTLFKVRWPGAVPDDTAEYTFFRYPNGTIFDEDGEPYSPEAFEKAVLVARSASFQMGPVKGA